MQYRARGRIPQHHFGVAITLPSYNLHTMLNGTVSTLNFNVVVGNHISSFNLNWQKWCWGYADPLSTIILLSENSRSLFFIILRAGENVRDLPKPLFLTVDPTNYSTQNMNKTMLDFGTYYALGHHRSQTSKPFENTRAGN